ncbi:MAG: zinc metallopeptidase [Erysipelotrichaceae bacterium]|nr:zinc metallopeptidase [Erysipelotrichaceae bacterium]
MEEIDYEVINMLLILVPFILSIFAQSLVMGKYNKYLKVENGIGLTGKEAAERFLRDNDVTDVSIAQTNGSLSDHYDPTKKVIYLSSSVYHGTSVSAVAIACHEVGHAIQHNQGYSFIKVRSALVKPVQFANQFSWILIIFGLLLSFSGLFWTGIVLFSTIAIFQLVTLPVELNASYRAREYLANVVTGERQQQGVRVVLRSAAFTYVVGLIASLAEILRFVLLFVRNNRD